MRDNSRINRDVSGGQKSVGKHVIDPPGGWRGSLTGVIDCGSSLPGSLSCCRRGLRKNIRDGQFGRHISKYDLQAVMFGLDLTVQRTELGYLRFKA
jgi:hypothetical protein